MAKNKGPLLSYQASGAVGDTLIYSSWKGRRYVKKLTVPKNPRAPSQLASRAMLRFLSLAWAQLSNSNRQSWEDYALQLDLPNYQAFLKYNLNRWSQFLFPLSEPDIAPTLDNGVIDALTSNALERSINVDTHITSASYNWGVTFYQNPVSGFTPTSKNCIAARVWKGISSGWFTYNTGPLPPGTYRFRVRSFGYTGLNNDDYTLQRSQVLP